jgi:RNA polymerase sigma-70 factor (sigma-E family)
VVSDEVDRSFEAFVQGRGPALLRSCYLLTGNRADAEDLLQTALLRCLKHWRRISADGAEEPYVRTVIVRCHITARRRRRLTETVTDAVPERAGSVTFTDAVDDRDQLSRALAELPAKTRAAVILRHYEGLSERETAAVLECSVGSVKALTSRGLQRLRVADVAAPPITASSEPAHDQKGQP